MIQFYYAFKAIINAKRNNLIKIISLSIGLLIALLLLSRVSYDASYDRFYQDADDLYLVKNHYKIGGSDKGSSHIVMAPMAPALNDEFPEVAYASSVYANKGEEPFFYETKKLELKPLIADSLFFKTLGVNVLIGDDRMLGILDNIFISDKVAEQIFGEENPIGKTLMYMQNHPYTIQGVFESIPENNSLRGDVVISFANVRKQFGLGTSWDGGDSFWGIVRLSKGAKPENINSEINKVWRKYFDYDRLAQAGFELESFISPFKDLRKEDSGASSMAIILSSLALIILLITALNSVLISISVLYRRSKEIGIHKCSGASSTGIFGMFMYETAILIFISLIVAVLLLFLFYDSIGMFLNVPLSFILSASNLWVTLSVILFLLLVGGILPAHIFSSIPVTQIFRTFTNNKRLWKKILLFFQFLGATFVTLVLIISIKQYNVLIDKDLGYDIENLVYVPLNGVQAKTGDETQRNIQLLQQELERFPFVETTATSMSIPHAYGGSGISDESGNVLFSSRYERADYNYIPTMRMEFVAGGNFTGPNQVIVTETFVKMMHWTDNPIGKEIKYYGKIAGVLKDYISFSLYAGQNYEPVLIQGATVCPNILTLRLSAISPENMRAIDEKLVELYPNDEMGLSILKDVIENQYTPVRNFRNITMLACFCIFLITLIGLLGYMSDEIHQKKKEIAIRKINGATVGDIFRLTLGNVIQIALPAVLLAATGAYYAGERLLQLFAEKVRLHALIFIGGSAAVLLIIVAIVVIKTWQTANENPSITVNRNL
ncbi:MAG: ABC transporter permease [Dysgonamonadaceae bacterium]|jgi:putative ABC transport system permease protein|nr:ABC transporter permease [Dysgonamonadaceae bacterium]